MHNLTLSFMALSRFMSPESNRIMWLPVRESGWCKDWNMLIFLLPGRQIFKYSKEKKPARNLNTKPGKLRKFCSGELKMVIGTCVVGKYLYLETPISGMAHSEFLLGWGRWPCSFDLPRVQLIYPSLKSALLCPDSKVT